MRKLLIAAAAVLALASGPALADPTDNYAATSGEAAENSVRMSVTDFLLDWKNYKGSRVTVDGCELLMLGNSLIYCYSDSNLTNTFIIDGENLPRQDRKVLLSGCTLFPPNCVADVTGTSSSIMFGQPTLLDASLKWTREPFDEKKLEEMIERTKKEQQVNGQ
jgi:hypothetical protein